MNLIYIVEDDPYIREIETITLKNSNYQVNAFERASDFFGKVKEVLPDLVLLDIMLPDEDGHSIVRKLRADPDTRHIPIIMITAKTSEMDMVRSLDEGADDYIKKPFSVMELLSRVKALLRRTAEMNAGSVGAETGNGGSMGSTELQVGGIVLNHERRLVKSGQDTVELTYKEYELLRYLMINTDIVLSRDMLMKNVWDTDFEGETRTVDAHIKTLRQKLGETGKQIKTVRNVGYVLTESAED